MIEQLHARLPSGIGADVHCADGGHKNCERNFDSCVWNGWETMNETTEDPKDVVETANSGPKKHEKKPQLQSS